MTADLRLGPWQTALEDVAEVDALIFDAPYSARVHGGDYGGRRDATEANPLQYDHLGPEAVAAFVESWSPRCKGWIVSITDHVLAPAWTAALEASGRYCFAPVPWVAPGSRVRLQGDGPSSWTCWIIVARPRTSGRWSKWGTLPGAYVINAERGGDAPITGTKPRALMEALVRDYSRPGDLVCDPFSGTGTTLLAARGLGRRGVGSELDPGTCSFAQARLAKPWQPLILPTSAKDREARDAVDAARQAQLFQEVRP